MHFKLVPDQTSITFTRWRMIAFFVSIVLLIASVALFVTRGLNLGVDFRGGVTIEASDSQPIDDGAVRNAIEALGIGNFNVTGIKKSATSDAGVVVTVGQQKDAKRVEAPIADLTPTSNDTVDSNADSDAEAGGSIGDLAEVAQQVAAKQVQEALRSVLSDDIDFKRVEVVGPTVSGELIQSGVKAVIFAIAMMLVYIWLRFEWQFSVGAILALTHDVILTIGVFSLTQLEFNLPIIAALLTIVGYSMNDTVVVYDRVRENLRKFKKTPLAELLDLSINDTLSRTVMTSVTTLLALIALYVLGGEVLRGFTFAMIWGVVVGTYSSIFIASPLLLKLGVKRDWSKNEVEAVRA